MDDGWPEWAQRCALFQEAKPVEKKPSTATRGLFANLNNEGERRRDYRPKDAERMYTVVSKGPLK
jgi:hypothetical protein